MTALPPPNWYDDPQSPAHVRWWDGTAWTQHTHPKQPVQPAQVAPVQVQATTTPAPKAPSFRERLAENQRKSAEKAAAKQAERDQRLEVAHPRVPFGSTLKDDIEVVGEAYNKASFRHLFLADGKPDGGVIYRDAFLVAEPRNPHDKYAIRVEIEGVSVGHVPAYLARTLQASVLKVEKSGGRPCLRARIWSRKDGNDWPARVTLLDGHDDGDESELDYAEQAREQKEWERLEHLRQKHGKVRGVYWGEHRQTIAHLKRVEQYDEAIILLDECITAEEQVSAATGEAPSYWPTDQARIVHGKRKDPQGQLATLRRFIEHCGEGQDVTEPRRQIEVVEHRLSKQRPPKEGG